MNTRNIVIIIVITAIFAAIAFTLFQREPEIEKVIITDSVDFSSDEEPEKISGESSFGRDSDIFLVIFVKNIKKESIFGIKWAYIEKGSEILLQEDSITVKNEGSGTVSVSLAKKDGMHKPGSYKTEVIFDGVEPFINEFNIK